MKDKNSGKAKPAAGSAKSGSGAKSAAQETAQPVSMAIDCPNCSGKARMTEHAEKIPHFGNVLLSLLACDKCGFKLSDVMCTDVNAPAGYSAEIAAPQDLEAKVIKSSTGTLKIPELGVVIEPGPSAEGYITNIEGVLDRIEAVTEAVIASKDSGEADEKRLARKELRRIQDAKKPMSPYKVFVEDPLGNSAIIGPKAKKFSIAPEELARLKKNIEVLELGDQAEFQNL